MLISLSLLIMLWAFVALAQAMPRHGKQIWGRALPDRSECLRRRFGFTLLLLSFLLLWVELGAVAALLLWLGSTTVASLFVSLLLGYRPHWLRWPGF